MPKENTIEHTGVVKSVDSDHVTVSIVAHPACSGCIASGICDLSDRDNKEIEASCETAVKVGERVIVLMKQTMGFRALFLGYLFPFLVVLFILISLSALSVPEHITGVTAFLSLIPYYTIIYLKKEKIGRSFSFTIKKDYK